MSDSLGRTGKHQRMELAEWIAALRRELSTALDAEAERRKAIPPSERSNVVPSLLLEKVTLELRVCSSKSGAAEAGIKFWVASGGASTSAEESTAQLIRLELSPEDDLPLGS